MTREDLIAGLTLRPVPADIPALPGVFLRPWSMAERSELIDWRDGHDDYGDLCAKVFALSVCDSNGVRLFTNEPGEVALIRATLDGQIVEAVSRRAIDMNGLGGDSPKA